MNLDHLKKLHDTVGLLRQRDDVLGVIRGLKESLNQAQEAFVWSSLNLTSLRGVLPEHIKSGWIFVLKPDVGSGCHYHPNSVQHMVMLEGMGKSKVAGVTKRMIPFGSPDFSLDESWHVIGAGLPHEFFPEESAMVVISFHTCEAHELEEVDCQSAKRRLYEG